MKRILSIILFVSMLSLAGCGERIPEWQEQYELGIQNLYQGDYQAAADAFNAAIEADGEISKVYIGSADAYIGLAGGDTMSNYLDSAEKALKNAQAHISEGEPVPANLAEMWYKLGMAYYEQELDEATGVFEVGQNQKAVECMERAVENGFNDREAYLFYANASLSIGVSSGNLGQTIKMLREAETKLDAPSLSIETKLEELEGQKAALDEFVTYLASDNIDLEDWEQTIWSQAIESKDVLSEYYNMCYDGESLYGSWITSELTGKGLKLTRDKVYYGDLVYGKPDGTGICVELTTKQPEYYTGQWKNGKPNGHGIYKQVWGSSEDFWEGEWSDGKATGEFTLTTESGKWEMAFEEGMIVVDERWKEDTDGSISITAVENYTDGDYFPGWGLDSGFERKGNLIAYTVIFAFE